MARSYQQIKSDKPYKHDEESHYPKDCKSYKEPLIPTSFKENNNYTDNPQDTADTSDTPKEFYKPYIPEEDKEPSKPFVFVDNIPVQRLIRTTNEILRDIKEELRIIERLLRKNLLK